MLDSRYNGHRPAGLSADRDGVTRMYAEDTIVAIATPPGRGAIGIIRASGPAVEHIANDLFVRSGGGDWESHRLYHGHLLRGGRALDDAMGVLMRAPRSYTGEDVFEVYCHGSPLVLRLALEAMLRAGARPAAQGEFTKRAFLNGKMDLAQAEAVVDLIGARTAEAAELAAGQLFGRLSGHLDELRKRLVHIKGQVEVRIDFSDEDIDIDDSSLVAETRASQLAVVKLLRSHARGQLLRNGLRVAIVGPPNAGKSSLLNALLDADRAIVTDVPGTTRDVIEECTDFDGVPVVLRDTAGIHETTDPVERIGVDLARKSADQSDVVLFVLDSSLPPFATISLDEIPPNAVIILNKVDIPCAWSDAEIATLAERHRIVRVSATKHAGLDQLRSAVVGSFDTQTNGTPTLTTSRQYDALEKVRDHLGGVLAGIGSSVPPDLLAVDLQEALDAIGTVTGTVSSEEVLDVIFGQFCIGK